MASGVYREGLIHFFLGIQAPKEQQELKAQPMVFSRHSGL